MRNRTMAVLGLAVLALAAGGKAQAESVTFTAGDVIAAMSAVGDPLHDGTDQWGLWAVRVRPIVEGSYTITGASTDQTGWGTAAPSWYSWSGYGSNIAWFYDESGAEAAGTAANPLYMIMDVGDDTFWSTSFNGSGTYVGLYHPTAGGTWYASGYDGGAGGTNLVTAVGSGSQFTFSFDLDSGSTWNGQWEFLVDGSRYTQGSSANPGTWETDFFGNYGDGGGLTGNMGNGYAVPEPVTMVMLGCLGGGMFAARKLRRKA